MSEEPLIAAQGQLVRFQDAHGIELRGRVQVLHGDDPAKPDAYSIAINPSTNCYCPPENLLEILPEPPPPEVNPEPGV